MEVKVDGQGLAGEDLEGYYRRRKDEPVSRVTLDDCHAFLSDVCLALLGAFLLAIRSLALSLLTGHGPSLPFN